MNNQYLIRNNNAFYKRALKREIGIWSNKKSQDFIKDEFHPVKFKWEGKNIILSKNIDWISLIKEFGVFENALILGGGDTALEEYLVSSGVVKKIENLDIINQKNSKNDIHRFNDLNFIQIDNHKYDIIIAKSILHHIINLEHLLLQVNSALTPNGIFVVFEYIGENKQQWSDKKIEEINKELDISNIIPDYKFNKLEHNYYNHWPFESIRSQEIPVVIDKIFYKEIETKWGKLNWPIDYHIAQYCFLNNIILEEKDKIYLKSRTDHLEEKYQNNPELLPSYLFGIYKRKSDNLNIDVIKWDRKKIRKELKLNGPLRIRLQSIKNTYKDSFVIKFLGKFKKLLKGA